MLHADHQKSRKDDEDDHEEDCEAASRLHRRGQVGLEVGQVDLGGISPVHEVGGVDDETEGSFLDLLRSWLQDKFSLILALVIHSSYLAFQP